MNLGSSHRTKHRGIYERLVVFCASGVVAALCIWTGFMLPRADAAQKDLPRNTLWEVVHNLCVPGESEHHDPKPCLQVDLGGGVENGFAILRDPRGVRLATELTARPLRRPTRGMKTVFSLVRKAVPAGVEAFSIRRTLEPSMRQALRAQPALLVRGGSRRIMIMRFRPANIRVINRRVDCPAATRAASSCKRKAAQSSTAKLQLDTFGHIRS